VTENSPAGLVMLDPAVTVTVTQEEHHQDVLSRYPVGTGNARLVAVELGWCAIQSGKYQGQQAVEVRLDGYRVGELTYAMSQRYGPMLNAIAARGGRPGCEALIHAGKRGVELDLRMPRETAVVGAPTISREPVVVSPRRKAFAKHRPAWIAGGVVAVILIAAIGSQNDSRPTANVGTVPAETTVSTSTASPTTTVAPQETVPVSTPPPKAPDAQPPAVTSRSTSKPPPPPATDTETDQGAGTGKCDPNYTGCVPIASDVDCEGGSGNGPAYVRGPIKVIGKDIYRLDNDHDGIACE
jgi:hypothetical protein